MTRNATFSLSLVFTPFSNQEGEWFSGDPEVREAVSESKLYMIGQREEVSFTNYRVDENSQVIQFDLFSARYEIRNVVLPVQQFVEKKGQKLKVAIGPKVILIYEIKNGKDRMLHWFTPDRLFMFYYKHSIVAHGMDGFSVFTNVNLYYVGISKMGDSFSRLFDTAHEKRSRILGNESQFVPTARLTDELLIFLFKIEDMQIISHSVEDLARNGIDLFNQHELSEQVLAADAEKAFIKILKSKYNQVTYQTYPISQDGLWGENLRGTLSC